MTDSTLRSGLRRFATRKDIDALLAEAQKHEGGLKRSLTARDLVILGVAGIIGAGIFVLVGKGAELAGAGVVMAFVIAAAICLVAGYAYAELASTIPASGSAYAYIYTAMGELPGWLVGWALVLEYAVGAIAVAVGWRNNFIAVWDQIANKLQDLPKNHSAWDQGWQYSISHGPFEAVPDELKANPALGIEGVLGVINIPSILIVVLITAILVKGTKESARLTAVLVAIKVSILLLAIGVGMYLAFASSWTNLDFSNLGPWVGDGSGFFGALSAVFAAAAIMFFAYIGFDSVSTTAEETKDPKKALPIGILGSLVITTVLYILASLALIGAEPWQTFIGNSQEATDARGEPFGYVFENSGQTGIAGNIAEVAAFLVRIGAIIGTTSVLLVLILGGVRVFFNMSRDGLLPPWLHRVSKTGSPAATTMFYGGITALFAGFLDLGKAVELVNIGTLFAFFMVIVAVWIFRIRRPDIVRPYRMPMGSLMNRDGKPMFPVVSLLGLFGIAVLMLSLKIFTLIAFFTWTGIGLLLYALYGISHSRVSRPFAPYPGAPVPVAAGAAPVAYADEPEVPVPEAVPAARIAAPPKSSKGSIAKASVPKAAAIASSKALTPRSKPSGSILIHNGYTLYAREIPTKDGGSRPLYFFAKQTPRSGEPSPLPPGFEVGVNERTGLPYLRKS